MAKKGGNRKAWVMNHLPAVINHVILLESKSFQKVWRHSGKVKASRSWSCEFESEFIRCDLLTGFYLPTGVHRASMAYHTTRCVLDVSKSIISECHFQQRFVLEMKRKNEIKIVGRWRDSFPIKRIPNDRPGMNWETKRERQREVKWQREI